MICKKSASRDQQCKYNVGVGGRSVSMQQGRAAADGGDDEHLLWCWRLLFSWWALLLRVAAWIVTTTGDPRPQTLLLVSAIIIPF